MRAGLTWAARPPSSTSVGQVGEPRVFYSHPVPSATPLDEVAIRAALSAPRTSTYVAATGGDTGCAVALYGWNARISAALYGARWPWDATFQRSLPSPAGQAFNPRRNLLDISRREPTTGKVIAELKFAFWQSTFTARHDVRVWDQRLCRAPGSEITTSHKRSLTTQTAPLGVPRPIPRPRHRVLIVLPPKPGSKLQALPIRIDGSGIRVLSSGAGLVLSCMA